MSLAGRASAGSLAGSRSMSMTPEQRAEQVLQRIRSRPSWLYQIALLVLGVLLLGSGLFMIYYTPEGGLGPRTLDRLIASGIATMTGGFVFLAAYFLARIRSKENEHSDR